MTAILDHGSAIGLARPLSIEFLDQPQDDAWDEFVESLPDGHHEQTSLWGQVRIQSGWDVSRVLVRQNGKIVAGAQIQIRPLRRLGRMAYVTYGPCLGSRDPVLGTAVIDGLKQLARLKNVHFMVAGLPYDGHALALALVTAGFQRKPVRFPPQFLEATAVINLAQEEEQIFAAMRRSTRRNIRHAEKKGIRVVEQSGGSMREFHRLMLALCARRKITPNPAQVEFLLELWRRFEPKGWIKLFFAMNGPEPVSAALAFTFGDWFRVWKVGWSGGHGNLKPNEVLWWQMILWAKQNGCSYFDFVEIDPDKAGCPAGNDVQGSSTENVTSFKLGFGGMPRVLPGAYFYVFNPVCRKLFHLGVGHWLDSPLILKAINPILGKLSRS